MAKPTAYVHTIRPKDDERIEVCLRVQYGDREAFVTFMVDDQPGDGLTAYKAELGRALDAIREVEESSHGIHWAEAPSATG